MRGAGANNLIFGAIARTSQGRYQLTTEQLHQRVPLGMEKSDPSVWWIDPEAGIALLHPQVIVKDQRSGEQAVLSLQGSIHSGGRNISPTSWPTLQPTDNQL